MAIYNNGILDSSLHESKLQIHFCKRLKLKTNKLRKRVAFQKRKMKKEKKKKKVKNWKEHLFMDDIGVGQIFLVEKITKSKTFKQCPTVWFLSNQFWIFHC